MEPTTAPKEMTSRGLLPGIILLLALLALHLVHPNAVETALANGDEEEYGEEDDYGEEAEASELAEGAGSLAWGGGIVATLAFVVYKHAYPRLVRMGIKPPVNMRHALNLHIVVSILLGLAAIYHGYSLRSYAGPVEYLAVGLIIVILLSGLTLRYVKNRHVKAFSRMIHAQRLLSILLLIAVLIHTATIGD